MIENDVDRSHTMRLFYNRRGFIKISLDGRKKCENVSCLYITEHWLQYKSAIEKIQNLWGWEIFISIKTKEKSLGRRDRIERNGNWKSFRTFEKLLLFCFLSFVLKSDACSGKGGNESFVLGGEIWWCFCYIWNIFSNSPKFSYLLILMFV